jgi:putative transposase
MGRVHHPLGDVHGRADHRGFEGAGGRAKTADICRKHGISSATFYKWKAKYGGLEVSDARRLKALEDENAKLKKLLAEAMLDNAMLKDIASKKW